MGANSKIEWTDHTFNPWIGCSKVHEGCTHCYAESLSKRTGKAVWGPNGTRVKTSDTYWQQPLKWNRDAEAAGQRRRVFCASLADVFEDWQGLVLHHKGDVLHWRDDLGVAPFRDAGRGTRQATLDDLRRDLFALIDATPMLDWLLLTKRPENVRRMWQPWGNYTSRPNVWLGTSISNQATADKMVPELLKCRDLCPVLFLSAEPLLGPMRLDLLRLDVGNPAQCVCGHGHGFTRCPNTGGISKGCHHDGCPCEAFARRPGSWSGIDWVIAGGESGHGARTMHPDWARSLRDQCQAAGVPFFFKQWGEWVARHTREANSVPVLPLMDKGRHGVFDTDGRWRPNEGEFTRFDNVNGVVMFRVGKKVAGRLLDGREWSEFPEAEVAHA